MMLKISFGFTVILALATSQGAIVGTNIPASPLTAERIAALPKDQQAEWTKYLKHSQQQWDADQAAFFKEMKGHKITESAEPPHKSSRGRLSLKEEDSWYAGTEGRRIADIVVSYQTPAGGWSKNLNMTDHKRAPGENYAGGVSSVRMNPADNDRPRDVHWSYVGTFDNDATVTQMRFLAKVAAALGKEDGAPYRKACLKGMDYVVAAQYPNGGWPQVWPLEGGYHDAITYNDDAMLNVMELLNDVSKGAKEFSWVAPKIQEQAKTAMQHGVRCILATQIVVNGHKTVWCQQHDALTLQPASARNYEMPSESGAESSKVLLFLMSIPNPDKATVDAIESGAAWLEKAKLHDFVFKAPQDSAARELVSTPGAPPLWSRYYQIGTDLPIFGDRDKTIHDDIREISKERRNGYSWFSVRPQNALNEYARWKKNHS